MKRRDFVKYLTYAGLALGTAGCFSKNIVQKDAADTLTRAELPKQTAVQSQGAGAKLVVAHGTDPASLIGKGFDALGGIETFVKPGNIVVIKPNFSVPRNIEEAATTNPFLVAALVQKCLAAKAKEVRIIDHTLANGRICLEKSGMYKNVTEVGGKVYVINSQTDNFYTTVALNGTILQNASYSKDVMEADVFINFPILKHHNGTGLTMGVKNLMGLVWNRGIFHSTDLNKTIAELAAFKKPHLTILDATRGITNNGPMGPGNIRECNQIVFGTDMLAVDAYGANLFDVAPSAIGHLSEAAKLGIGTLDWQSLPLLKV